MKRKGRRTAVVVLLSLLLATARAENVPDGAYRAVAPPTPEPTPAPATIVITALGDCTLSYQTKIGGGTNNFGATYDKYGAEYFFKNVRELLMKDDLTIANFEGTLTNSNDYRPKRPFNFKGKPEYVDILTYGSVEVCTLANNHALDYKQQGFDDTCEALTNAGIAVSGYGLECYLPVKGYTVCSLSFSDWDDKDEDILKAVRAAREKCDLLIVSIHWGEERVAKMSSHMRELGCALVDAGADLVIGNHAHITGQIERYKGKYIIAHVGNFCFGGNTNPKTKETLIFRQAFTLTPGGVQDAGIDLVPAKLTSVPDRNNYQPMIADKEEGKRILKNIYMLSTTMKEEMPLWMDDSWIYENGLLERP